MDQLTRQIRALTDILPPHLLTNQECMAAVEGYARAQIEASRHAAVLSRLGVFDAMNKELAMRDGEIG